MLKNLSLIAVTAADRLGQAYVQLTVRAGVTLCMHACHGHVGYQQQQQQQQQAGSAAVTLARSVHNVVLPHA